MQISANTVAYGSSEAQRLLAGLLQTKGGGARQEKPSATSETDGPPSGPPPGPPPGGGAQQFASKTLSGLLSTQETPPSASDVASKLIQDADSDGDGALSLAEIESTLGTGASDQLSASVAKLDTDGDGKLNADELSAGLEAARPKGGRPPPPSSADVASSLIGETDANGDGALSLDEILTKLGQDNSDEATSAFGKLDTNSDGQLSSAELTAALDAFRAAHANGQGETSSSQTVATA